MKRVLHILLSSIVLTCTFACSSTKKTSTPTDQKTELSIDRDGSSFEKAVIVNSVSDEYVWLRKNYPGSMVQSQALVSHNKKPYDVLTLTMEDGSTRKFYFDISKFFGKGF